MLHCVTPRAKSSLTIITIHTIVISVILITMNTIITIIGSFRVEEHVALPRPNVPFALPCARIPCPERERATMAGNIIHQISETMLKPELPAAQH